MALMNLLAGQQWRCRHREQTCGHSRRQIERVTLTCVHYNMQSSIASGNLLYDAGSSNLVLCDNLEGWDGVRGRFKWEGIRVYLWLIHVDIWQKPMQYFKAIIL